MPSLNCRLAALIVLLFTAIHLATALAGDWPTFRGPDRTAVSKDVGLLTEWPADGPPLVWKAEGTGRGYSSLAIVGDRIFTLGDQISIGGGDPSKDTDEYLMCLERNNGKLIWKTKTGPAWDKGQSDWQSSRSTPTVDGDRVYALTADGVLVCCDVKTGGEQWRKSLKSDFGGKKADGWGYSESVLVDGDQVVCTPGGTQTTMVALDKRTGDVKWKTVREDDIGAGHASIVISEIGGTRVYVQTTGLGALGVRTSDGKVLWSYQIGKTTAVIPTPIVRGDLVFFTAGYQRGGALLRQVPDGAGGINIDEIYPLKPELANKHGGVVLVGDYIYGDSDSSGVPFCAELMTGKIMWKKRGSGKGSAAVVAADGHLYFQFSDGTVALVKASPDEYTEVSTFKAPGSGERPSWAHPVVLDGRLYIREQDVILCYDVRAKGLAFRSGN
jgi:outer membrane protein assembly factor BamB